MAKFMLSYKNKTFFIDSDDLDPGELQALKALGKQPHFTFKRNPPVSSLTGLDHDPLDDIAREIVAKPHSYGGQVGELVQQAKRRVSRLQHRRLS